MICHLSSGAKLIIFAATTGTIASTAPPITSSTSFPSAALAATAALAAARTSVLTLNLQIDARIARRICSSGKPDAPCSTSGVSPASARTASSLAQSSSGGETAYLPCTFPMVTASASTLVAARKDATTAGSVIFASFSATESPSSSPASKPSSASTEAPAACTRCASDAVQRLFSSSGLRQPSSITPCTPAARALSTSLSPSAWSSCTSSGAAQPFATSRQAAMRAVPPKCIDAGCSCSSAGKPVDSAARRTARAPSRLYTLKAPTARPLARASCSSSGTVAPPAPPATFSRAAAVLAAARSSTSSWPLII
mmetsp:Transcript_20322/g.67286  ORF Transcript_20322/g.67286 Transcript_20322/m.67286 type:complete len:312 (-) Transcript_20322:38-973(-)